MAVVITVVGAVVVAVTVTVAVTMAVCACASVVLVGSAPVQHMPDRCITALVRHVEEVGIWHLRKTPGEPCDTSSSSSAEK